MEQLTEEDYSGHSSSMSLTLEVDQRMVGETKDIHKDEVRNKEIHPQSVDVKCNGVEIDREIDSESNPDNIPSWEKSICELIYMTDTDTNNIVELVISPIENQFENQQWEECVKCREGMDCVLELCEYCNNADSDNMSCEFCLIEIDSIVNSCDYCSGIRLGASKSNNNHSGVASLSRKDNDITESLSERCLGDPGGRRKGSDSFYYNSKVASLSRKEDHMFSSLSNDFKKDYGSGLGHQGSAMDQIPESLSRNRELIAQIMDPECESQEPDVVFDAIHGFDRYCKYTPVEEKVGLPCYKDRTSRQKLGGITTSWNIPAWEHELEHETDTALKSYIYSAVKYGVLIVDHGVSIPQYDCSNYASAMTDPAFSFLNQLILKELDLNRLVLTENKPHCIHSIGAIPKSGGGWRPITDCRRPLGSSINNYMSTTFKEFSFKTVDDVSRLVKRDCYMATVDIDSAYRTVTVAPQHWTYQGLRWPINGQEAYVMDTSLCFGLRCAPYVFNQISNFITRCLRKRGYNAVINYLDDYWVTGNTFHECQSAQMTLIEILGSLGFLVSFKKCTTPATKVTYLGIEFNSTSMTIALPQSKMEKLKTELEFFKGRTRATVRQMQRLCGIVSHASKVIKGGRTFSRRMIDLLKGLPNTQKRVRLSHEFLKDLTWWESVSSTFNGKELVIPWNDGNGIHFVTDASKHGYGIVYGQAWQAGFYNHDTHPTLQVGLCADHGHWKNVRVKLHDPHISLLELIPVWLCVQAHASEWANQHVVCFCDNNQVVFMINKGTSSNAVAMNFIRSIFWHSAVNNFHLTARHIRGIDNGVADVLSRIYSKGFSALNSLNLCCCRGEKIDEGKSPRIG